MKESVIDRLSLSNIDETEIVKLGEFINNSSISDSYERLLAEALCLIGTVENLKYLLTENGDLESFTKRHSTIRLASILKDIRTYQKLKESLEGKIDEIPTSKVISVLVTNSGELLPRIQHIITNDMMSSEDVRDAVEILRIDPEVNLEQYMDLAPYTRKSIVYHMRAGDDFKKSLKRANKDIYRYGTNLLDFYESQAMIQRIDFKLRKRLIKKALSEGVSVSDIEWANPLYLDIIDFAMILDGLARGYDKHELMFYKTYTVSLSDDQLRDVLTDIKNGLTLRELILKYDRESELVF